MSAISEARNTGEAAGALDAILSEALMPVSVAVRQAIAAQGALREAEDLVPVMQAAVGVILACEAMQDAAKEAESVSRRALAEAMGLGATTVIAGSHTASLRDAPQTAIVTSFTDLPTEFLTTPPPRPDLAAIRKALTAGRSVPGCQLSNGGAATVQIRTKG